MLRTSVIFFVIGLLAITIGIYGIGGVPMEWGRIVMFVCLGISILTFIGGLTIQRGASVGIAGKPLLLYYS